MQICQPWYRICQRHRSFQDVISYIPITRFKSFYSTQSHLYDPTIYALSTVPAKSAIAILRATGPNVLDIWNYMTQETKKEPSLSAITKTPTPALPKPRYAHLRSFIDPKTSSLIDQGLVLYFPPNASYTGKPLLELHPHGSPAVIKKLLQTLSDTSIFPSFRIALPGEFTRLALESGRMDLTQVEGLNDLLNAQTDHQRNLAIQQASGASGTAYNKIRDLLIDALAQTEALIDFAEDDHIDPSVIDHATNQVNLVKSEIHRALNNSKRHELLRSGISLAIFGPPNMGKSTLINKLAQREAAIVSPIAGTTRDVIELTLDFHGYPIVIADTAGIRTQELDAIEAIGIDRAKQKVSQANIKICVVSVEDLHHHNLRLDDHTLSFLDSSTILVINKMDLYQGDSLDTWIAAQHPDSLVHKVHSVVPMEMISTQSDHLDHLEKTLLHLVKNEFNSTDSDVSLLVTQERHKEALSQCLTYLDAFEANSDDIVLASEYLRLAARAVGSITSTVDVEAVLDRLFASFCIGK